MNLKQLKLNIDKCSYILLGSRPKVEEIRKFISKSPLLLSGNETKEKTNDKYLGEHLHSEGLSETIAFTVQQRHWLAVSAIMEIKTIINDYRINTPGGLNTGILLWELAVIPMILNNSETWNDIDAETLKILEDLQNTFLRYLFSTPRTSPTPALCWDSGLLKMKYRIWQKQINFLFHISKLHEDTLAKQVYLIQQENRFPGLVIDTFKKMDMLKLPFDCRENNKLKKGKIKKVIKNAILTKCENELMKEIKSLDKLKDGPMTTEEFSKRPYINTLIPENARELFKFRSKMFNAKFNYKSDPRHSNKLWKCNSCQSGIESQDHVLWCPSYSSLREGKNIDNDEDLAEYLKNVLIIRDKLNLIK